MNVFEYRLDSKRCSAASELLQNPVLIEMIGTLRETINSSLCPEGLSSQDHSLHLGRVMGFNEALNALSLMGTLSKPLQDPVGEPTYPPPSYLEPEPEL